MEDDEDTSNTSVENQETPTNENPKTPEKTQENQETNEDTNQSPDNPKDHQNSKEEKQEAKSSNTSETSSKPPVNTNNLSDDKPETVSLEDFNQLKEQLELVTQSLTKNTGDTTQLKRELLLRKHSVPSELQPIAASVPLEKLEAYLSSEEFTTLSNAIAKSKQVNKPVNGTPKTPGKTPEAKDKPKTSNEPPKRKTFAEVDHKKLGGLFI